MIDNIYLNMGKRQADKQITEADLNSSEDEVGAFYFSFQFDRSDLITVKVRAMTQTTRLPRESKIR